MVGLMATSSKRAYAIPRPTAPRDLPLQYSTSSGDTQHSSVSVSVETLGPGMHKVCLTPLSVSGGYGF